MRVLILGAAGMIGRKLASRIAADGCLADRRVTGLDLVDVVLPPVPPGLEGRTSTLVADIAQPGVAARLLAQKPDIILHLAAVVSGEAEVDFQKGYSVPTGVPALSSPRPLRSLDHPFHP